MNKLIQVILLTIAVFQHADCKRTKSNKLTSDTEESTPKPSVLTYSTFGFNDVGHYDGFVPTSPDFANIFPGNEQESSTRLYAPAFPTNLDSSGFGENYGSSPDGQSLPSDEQLQTSMSKYQPGNLNYFTSPSFDDVNDPNKLISDSSIYSQIDSNNNSPIYGAKLNYPKQKIKTNEYKTEYNASKNEISNINAEAFIRNQDTYIQQDTKQNVDGVNYHNYPPPYQSSLGKYSTTTVVPLEYENENIQTPSSASAIKFPKVIDFTNMNPYFTNNDNRNIRFPNPINPFTANTDDKVYYNGNTNNFNNDFDKNMKPFPHLKHNNFNSNNEAQKNEKEIAQLNFIANQGFSQNYFNNKNKLNGKYSFNYDKLKKPWDYSSKDENGKKSRMPGYQYPTNHTTTNSKYGNLSRRPFNNSVDEIVPASSNLDYYNYQHPETDFGSIKNYPHLQSPFDDNENTGFGVNYVDKYKPLNEYQNTFKNVYTTLPTATSHWGNLFKQTEFSPHKIHLRKPVLQEDNGDIVHIPKRPSSGKYGTQLESDSFDEWVQSHKPHKQQNVWPKENHNRYKSEEDLLDLRNHDFTHSSYPPFRPGYYEPPEDLDYKKLVDKWKQNYLKSKYKYSNREYETYASETKPVHVPVPKPYPIEVPHPVIVPVPQPYPVHVPIPKPVAVPVIRELTVPIEKPVPYPVYKKVPYPIEKPVPVPVVRQVHVPIIKPYPIAVPQVRPLFHHTRPHDDRDPDLEDDDGYRPRPESEKRTPNLKRLKNKRQPPRRPSRMTYQDRDRRRAPQRRPSRDQRHRPSQSERRPTRHHDEYEEYEPDYIYCKRTGDC